jgi:hypothetical protein
VSDHGDVFAFALIATMAIFAVVFRPAAFAAEFDHLAELGQSKGFRITPYVFATLATHLDPSRPDYAMRVADIEDARGHKADAKNIRTEIHSDWAIYRAFAKPVTKKTAPVQAASIGGSPAPARTVTTPGPAAPAPGGQLVQTVTSPEPSPSNVPMGPELPPVTQTTAPSTPGSASAVTQGVAAPASPVKITTASPTPATKTTTTTTKTTSTKAATTTVKPTTKTTKTTKKTATVHRSSPTTTSTTTTTKAP